MKTRFAARAVGVAVLGLAAVAAQAQDADRPLRGYLGAGVTFGGDKLVAVTYSDGSKGSVSAGGLIDLRGGASYRVAPEASVRASFGYHLDRVNASNGNVRFERYPIELLGFWHANDKVSVGGGLRQATSPKLRGSGFATGAGANFKATLGLVIEGEYAFSDTGAFYLRGVMEDYKINGDKVDGSHVGLGFNFHF